MNDTIYFSIVIPLYNKFEYIQKTIDSVLSQTYPYFEVIVVDDGSTDGSSSIIEILYDERIRLIKQENKGVSAARNRGISESKFEFIAFIDGDDWWNQDFLATITHLIHDYPNLDLFATKYAMFKNNRVEISHDGLSPRMKNISFNLFEIGLNNTQATLPINSSNIVIRKKSLLEVGCFDERIHFFEDYDLFMRLACFSEIAYSNHDPLSFYCQDISIDKRATGKLPSFNKNLFFYTEKMKYYFKDQLLFEQYYLKLFAIYAFDYWTSETNHNAINQLLLTLNIKKFPLKYKILYSLPYQISRNIISLYKKLNKE